MVSRAHIVLAGCLILAGCLDATGDRTQRDFEEIGNADLGAVRVRIEPGVALATDPARRAVRFRANAPAVTLRLHSTAEEPTRVRVEVTNLVDGVRAEPALPLVAVGPGTVQLDLDLPAGGDVVFTLANPALEAVPFRVAWVGDVQGGNARFARLRERINADPGYEFVLFAGDITQQGGVEEHEAFQAEARQLRVPWYSLLGNHETIQGHEQNFERLVGRLNVAFDYRGARFLLLDSASATVDARVYDLIEQALARPGAPARIAGMHLPPFDYSGLRDGGFSSRAEGAKMMSLLAGGGVDLLLAGHIHTLDMSDSGKVQTVVSGNGGVEREALLDGSSVHFTALSIDPGAGRVEAVPVHVE